MTCGTSISRREASPARRYAHQQRQFFISYAVVWNTYRTDEELMQQLKTDVHSVSFNRVNGISRLLDDWYDLFGVKPGDKLYLAPADRVKIW